MNGKEFFLGILLGVVCCFLVGMLVTHDTKMFVNELAAMKSECESTLPRNQECTIKYIAPVSSKLE